MHVRAAAVVFVLSIIAAGTARAADPPAAEYARHLNALGELSVAVAQTMPAEKYGFKPHPESMSFGELMDHIATTNYQFCAGLSDAKTPALPRPTEKDGIVRFLGDSFQYCSGVINGLNDQQLAAAHDSPDGHMPGRDILLAMYIHVAHHRGQAEIYLRDEGIRPPRYHT
ncbi:MAG TPA: DinB family protein [Acidobacteriaceae bacterium]|nr:DinB family protein [Acidobacteriaceae bacterium]